MTRLLDKVEQHPFVGYSAAEIVRRDAPNWGVLTKRYEGATSEAVFNPFDDERLADCYNFLYKRDKDARRDLGSIKDSVDRSLISAGRLVMSSWLNAFLYAQEGQIEWEVAEALIGAMKEKGDGVLMASDNPLNIPKIKAEFFDPEVQVGSWVAISLGSKQMVEMMAGKGGPLESNQGLYKKMSEGALIRQDTARVK